MTETILPPNRGAFEEAADKAGAGAVDLPLHVSALIRPADAPAEFLPWLAWGRSVDFWRADWPDEKKRSLIAEAARWHRIKGTQAALERGVEIMGARVQRVVTPPAQTHLAPALTDAEREAFLARFAQLRVYPFVARGHTNVWARYLGEGSFLGPVSAVRSQWVRTAFLWDRGQMTPLTFRTITSEKVGHQEATEFDEVILSAKPTRAIHLDAAPMARPFLIDDIGVRERFVRIGRSKDLAVRARRERWTTVQPDGDLIEVRPALIAEPHPAQSGSRFAGGGARILGGFLPPSIAWRFIYERWHIHDPERVPDVRRRGTHLGRARLGIPAYHAEVQIAVRGRRCWRVASRFVAGHLAAASRAGLRDARAGAKRSMAARDRVKIDTITRRPLRVGDRARVGRAKVGQIIEV